jgi:hypothetical protein
MNETKGNDDTANHDLCEIIGLPLKAPCMFDTYRRQVRKGAYWLVILFLSSFRSTLTSW